MIYSNECYLRDRCNKYKRDKSCECNQLVCRKLSKLDTLYNKSLLSKKQRINIPLIPSDTDVEKFDRLSEIGEKIVDFVEKGGNLYICSTTPGNGKTSWAVKLMQKYFDQIWAGSPNECRGIFINVPWFLLSLKTDISNKSDEFKTVKDSMMTADLVIWDDIATKFATEFEQENLLSIIDFRMREGKSNIFTSNILPEQLSTSVGGRLASRVAEASECIIFNGSDRRKNSVWQ